MIKKLISYFFLSLIVFILLEISLYVINKIDLLNIILPTYSMDSPEHFLPERSFMYGFRHQPNSTYEVKKSCLHTYYNYNSLGFRDQEAKKQSKEKRVLVLGDSFMEGIGVDEKQRLGDLLEKQTKIQHLNFGMADKGPTQSYVIYNEIASAYEHDAVLISIFPSNDFIDDDPNIGKNSTSIRPCWIGNYPNYTLSFVPDSAPAKIESSYWKHFLKTHTYSYDALHYLKEVIRTSFSKESYPTSGYFDYSEEQANRLFYSLQKIKEKAGDRKLILLCIPSHLDLKSEKDSSLSIELKLAEFCKNNNIEFIGLYDEFKNASSNPSEDFYYRCDSHWNPAGHGLAAKTVLQESSYYKNILQDE